MQKSLFLLIFLISFKLQAQEKLVDLEKSMLTWHGYKVAGQHEGNLKLKSGKMIFENGILKKAEFIVDMTSMTVNDLEGNKAEKLLGQLKDDSFFGVDKYETASLKVNKVELINGSDYRLSGNLTIKNTSNQVDFKATINNQSANANISIDREKFEIKHNSFLFNALIKDDFDIDVSLYF